MAPCDPPMTHSNGINLTLTKVGCSTFQQL
jgi:hypothetical protein